MKKMNVFLSVVLVLCMMLSFAPMRGQASASRADWEWYWNPAQWDADDWNHMDAWNRRGSSGRYDGWYYSNGWYYKDGWYVQGDRWYQVDFTTVRIPVEVESGSTVSNGTATAAGTTTRLVDTSFSYYFNEWAGTLIIRGTGVMPSFDKEHPAPWANLKDKVSRVILERNITTISSNAFMDFSRLKSIVLPATLKTIDPGAFIWSDEVRQLKTFQKLERIEFSGNLDDLDTILKKCSIQDLLDARVVKVTETAIQNEIWMLTWYRIQSPVRVQYDQAGRPIRIIRIDSEGNYFDTVVQYDVTAADPNVLSESEQFSPDVSSSLISRDVIEKRTTFSETSEGMQHVYNFEKNDLGETTYFARFGLTDGYITSGSHQFYDEYGLTKSGTLASVNNSVSGTVLIWNNILAEGTYEEMIETLNAAGKISKVETRDKDGNTTATTENSYDSYGRLYSTVTTENTTEGTKTTSTNNYQYNSAGQLVSYEKHEGSDTATVVYDYNPLGVLVSKTQASGTTMVITDYNRHNRAVYEVVKENDEVKYTYEYSYKDDVVTQRTIKDSNGKVVGVDTFDDAGHLIKSVRETASDGSSKTVTTTTFSYDESGNLKEKETTETVSVKVALKRVNTVKNPESEATSSEETPVESEGNETKQLSLSKTPVPSDTGDGDYLVVSTRSLIQVFDAVGNVVSEEENTSYGEINALRSFTLNEKSGEIDALFTSLTEEDATSNVLEVRLQRDIDANLISLTEKVTDSSNITTESKYSLGSNDQLISLNEVKTDENGNMIEHDFSTFSLTEDGYPIQRTSTMATKNSYIVSTSSRVLSASPLTPLGLLDLDEDLDEVFDEDLDEDPDASDPKEEEDGGSDETEETVAETIADAKVPLALDIVDLSADESADTSDESEQETRTDVEAKEVSTADKEVKADKEDLQKTVIDKETNVESTDETEVGEVKDVAGGAAEENESSADDSTENPAGGNSVDTSADVPADDGEIGTEPTDEDDDVPVADAESADDDVPEDDAQPADEDDAKQADDTEENDKEAASEGAQKATEEKAAKKADEEVSEKVAEEEAPTEMTEESSKKAAEEEAAAKKTAEEEAAAKKAAEEEAAAKKAAEEEAAKRAAAEKAAAEEAARQAAEAARQAAAEEAARQAAEEAARQAAEEAAKRAAAEKAAAEEAARQAAEAARQAAAEEAARQAAEEAAKQAAAAEEAAA